VAAYGLTVEVPGGWDVRISRRPAVDGGTVHPVLHAATFPLPLQRGDFGGGAVELMRGDDVLVVLFEYDREAAATALFARRGTPPLRPAEFSPRQLQRVLPKQSGVQHFFTERGRSFCRYVVLGDHSRRVTLCAAANRLLGAVSVGP
jgi:hypothetical protein